MRRRLAGQQKLKCTLRGGSFSLWYNSPFSLRDQKTNMIIADFVLFGLKVRDKSLGIFTRTSVVTLVHDSISVLWLGSILPVTLGKEKMIATKRWHLTSFKGNICIFSACSCTSFDRYWLWVLFRDTRWPLLSKRDEEGFIIPVM